MNLVITVNSVYQKYEQLTPSPSLEEHIMSNLSHLLIATNSAVNIVVYFLKVLRGAVEEVYYRDRRMDRWCLQYLHIRA